MPASVAACRDSRISIFFCLVRVCGSERNSALPEKIDFREIDDFIAAPGENRLEREQAEPFHLLGGDRWRHGQFLPVYENFHQRRPVVLQSLGDHRPNLSGCFSRQTEQSGAFGHF